MREGGRKAAKIVGKEVSRVRELEENGGAAHAGMPRRSADLRPEHQT